MKGKVFFSLLITLIAALSLAGCGAGAGGLGLVINDDNTATITMDGGAEGDFAAAGSLIVEENEMLVLEPQLDEDGVVHIQLYPDTDAGIDAEPEELLAEPEEGDLVVDTDIGGTDPVTCVIPAGDYMVQATVVAPGKGTI